MAGLKIHLPKMLDPDGKNDLVKVLCEKVGDGITGAVGKKISRLTQLGPDLRIGGLDTNWNLRQVKTSPVGGDLRIGGLNTNWNLRQVKTSRVGGDLNTNWNLRQLRTTPVGGLNLETDLDFDY